MSYTDRLMSSGERIVLVDRQHWFVVLASGRYAVAAIVGALLLVIVQAVAQPTGALADVLSWTALGLFIIGLVLLVYEMLRYQNQQYVITNRRVLEVSGIINKHSGDSSLEKINDAILSQPVLGRMMNYGDLEILTAADQANDLYRMLNNPKNFKKVMLQQKHALETEFQYVGGPPPSPPLRAPAELTPAPAMAAAAPAAPAPAPAASTPVPTSAASFEAETAPDTRDESLEITQTLARLADLRDSGAITPEEYEQKKGDLLSRL